MTEECSKKYAQLKFEYNRLKDKMWKISLDKDDLDRSCRGYKYKLSRLEDLFRITVISLLAVIATLSFIVFSHIL